jgi:hypothetical protein
MNPVYLLLMAGLCSFYGCKNRPFDRGNGMLKAMVIDGSGIAGCGFLLVTADGNRFQPENLPEKFRKDSLKVYVRMKEVKRMTACMSGKTVVIEEIKKAKR